MPILTSFLLLAGTSAAAAPSGTPKPLPNDAPRVSAMLRRSRAAYGRLHSYSGRFYFADGESFHTGEICWARPNRLAMRFQTRGKDGSYSYRAVCDGRFLYLSGPHLRGEYLRQDVSGEEPLARLGDMMGTVLGGPPPFLGKILRGENWFEKSNRHVRITSAPRASVLSLDVRLPEFDGWGREKSRAEDNAPAKVLLRFGPDNLLRTLAGSEAGQTSIRVVEKHWDIRLNPALPASTFRWKPAPGARQATSRQVAR